MKTHPKPSTNEPHHKKAGLWVSDQVQHKPGDTTTEDCWRLEISDLGSGVVLSVLRKRALISFAVTKRLICIFVFAYVIGQLSHDAAQMIRILRVLTHQKPLCRFCMLFFEVLPFTTLAVSVNGKTSKKSVQK